MLESKIRQGVLLINPEVKLSGCGFVILEEIPEVKKEEPVSFLPESQKKQIADFDGKQRSRNLMARSKFAAHIAGDNLLKLAKKQKIARA